MDSGDNWYITADRPWANQPKGVRTPMYSHQLANLYEMERRERMPDIHFQTFTGENGATRTKLGLLGDLPGYGKTLTILGLIANNKVITDGIPPINLPILYDVDGLSISINRNFDPNIFFTSSTLIVVPPKLVTHWQNEIAKHTDLTFYTIDDKNLSPHLDHVNIVLLRSDKWSKFMQLCEKISWARIIYDEADNIPSLGCGYKDEFKKYRQLQYHTRYEWFVTATYDKLFRNFRAGQNLILVKFSHILSIENVALLPLLTVRCSEEFLKQSFDIIPYRENRIKRITPIIVSFLSDDVSSSVKDKLNGGDIEGALKEMGCQSGNLTTIIRDEYIKKINNLNKKINDTDQLTSVRRAEKDRRIAEFNQSIIEYKKKIEDIESGITLGDLTDDTCQICMCEPTNEVLVKCCGKIFCAPCITQWIAVASNKQQCPNCRAEINGDMLIVNNQSKFDSQVNTMPPPEWQQLLTTLAKDQQSYYSWLPKDIDNIVRCHIMYGNRKSKLNTTIDLIKNKPTGRFLIFSAVDFKNLKQGLTDNGINFKEAKGPWLNKYIAQFKTGAVNVFLLDSKHNGAGLDFSEATDIIIYHRQRSEIERQNIGRGQRHGRTCQLTVHYLEYDDEYD